MCLNRPRNARENAPLRPVRRPAAGFAAGSPRVEGIHDPPNDGGRGHVGGSRRAQRVPKGRGRGGHVAASEVPPRATSGGRMDLVSESPAMGAASSVADDCRRLAERLRLDAVGVAIGVDDDRQVTWWAASDGPPLPARLDDILDGTDAGWLLVRLASGDTVFARTTPDTPDRAIEILRAMATSLVAGAGGASTRAESAEHASTAELEPGDAAESGLAGLYEGTGTPGLAGVLAALARDTGFETASLFTPNGI